MNSNNENSLYSLRGVSATKNEVHNAIKNLDKGLFPNAFCKIVPDFFTNDPNFALAIHADGAGTKSLLAYLYFLETNDISVWKGIAQDAIVMNTDDLLCIGAVNNFLISTTICRNKYRISGEILKTLIEGVEEFLDSLRKNGINIHSGGGETADMGDVVRTLTVDSNAVCRIKRNEIVSNHKIQADDVIVGLSSTGKAIYENVENSGVASNGLTSIRHDLLSKYYPEHFTDIFDNFHLETQNAYTGKFRLTDFLQEANSTVGQLILSPTRTYLPVFNEIFQQLRNEIHGIVHCTGGGQTKVLNFVENLHIIKNNLFDIPYLFRLIQSESNTSWQEMYQVYNLGHRMEIYVSHSAAQKIIKISQDFGIEAKMIGFCEKSDKKRLTIISEKGEFHY